jgi:cytochrome oxidase Cu insertion factor (SCO1/SenC/PrrC family)
MGSDDMSERSITSGRHQVLWILLIAAASFGGAYALYFAAPSIGLWGTTNHGAFVDPPVAVEALQLTDAGGQPFATATTWWLWVVQPGPCDAACDRALQRLQQVHQLLNRDAPRVHRAIVSPVAIADGALAAKYPGLEFLAGRIAGLEPGLYIVDPLGNLVLRYPPGAAGKSVLDDLKRLLKVSQIG